MNESNEITLKEAIQKLIDSYHLEEGLFESNVINSWEKIAGKLIAKHTEKIFVKEKRLYLKLDSPALKHELSYARDKLLSLIDKEVGQNNVTEIIFL